MVPLSPLTGGSALSNSGPQKRIRFEELTREELHELAPRATAVVPVGSTEQHGAHLPVATDSIIVSALATRAVEEASRQIPVVLTPTLPFGFSHYHRPFGGTISINLKVYSDLLEEVGESLALDGFSRVFFLNGHGGNDAAVRGVGDRLLFERDLKVHVAATSYWTCAAKAVEELDLGVGPFPGHAGGFETSCVLALNPDLVHRDRLPPPENDVQPLARDQPSGVVLRRPGLWEASDGRTDDARRATSQAGERALKAISHELAECLVTFHKSTS